MSEATKTVIYATVALVLAAIAFFSYPRTEEFEIRTEVEGKPLFAGFDDPDRARRMKIYKINPDLGNPIEFEIARDQKSGLWTVPTEDNYPVDADEQMRDAATALVNLPVIDVLSDLASEHEMWGVVEPAEDLPETQEGVGTLVTIEYNDADDKLQKLELIIGKRVSIRSEEDAAGGPEDKQFAVRKAGEDPIYLVSIDPSKYSTKFKDWIEKDLLNVDAFDIQQLKLRDYSVPSQIQPGGRVSVNIVRRMDATVDWDSEQSKWNLGEMMTFDSSGNPLPSELGPFEELNTQKLNDTKNALADLKIDGVVRKPEGLTADLRTGEAFGPKSQSSLVLHGFFPLDLGRGEEIYSESGEVLFSTRDGVQYVLRFGRTAGLEEGTENLNRYLMVTARLDEAQFADLKNAPTTEPSEAPKAPQTDGGDSGECGPGPQDAGGQDTGDQDKKKQDEKKKDEEKKDEKKKDADHKQAEAPKKQGETKKQDDEAETSDRGNPLRDAQDTAESAEKQAEPAAEQPGQEPPLDPLSGNKVELDPAEAEAARKEAERKLNELRDKHNRAKGRVASLNYRFGDWYYIISESEYKKIRLGRTDIVSETAAAQEEGFNVDAFRQLQEGGLDPGPDTGPPPGGPGFPPGGGLPPGLNLPPGTGR